MTEVATNKTLAETIREQLSPLEIRIAVAAIVDGVCGIQKREADDYGKETIKTYNYGFAQASDDMAAKILFEIFECCAADCKMALEKMAADKDLWLHGEKIPVFDRFIDELNNRLNGMARLRKVEKVEIF